MLAGAGNILRGNPGAQSNRALSVLGTGNINFLHPFGFFTGAAYLGFCGMQSKNYFITGRKICRCFQYLKSRKSHGDIEQERSGIKGSNVYPAFFICILDLQALNKYCSVGNRNTGICLKNQ
ncbi:MAG TPA: hypothetical protein DC049_14765 [Spirochaetia bacterium]|nr:hypothetical protein [Spirochaetia bacterium]